MLFTTSSEAYGHLLTVLVSPIIWNKVCGVSPSLSWARIFVLLMRPLYSLSHAQSHKLKGFSLVAASMRFLNRGYSIKAS